MMVVAATMAIEFNNGRKIDRIEAAMAAQVDDDGDFPPRIVQARDRGQWGNNDPATSIWYRGLMQPDNPNTSCCGESDAYFCDDVTVREGKTFCQITDDRDDVSRRRPHRNIGEEFEIPPHKLKWDRGNPTGHAVVFLTEGGAVLCFVQGSGT